MKQTRVYGSGKDKHLQIRINPQIKEDFTTRCRREGVSATDVLGLWIDVYRNLPPFVATLLDEHGEGAADYLVKLIVEGMKNER